MCDYGAWRDREKFVHRTAFVGLQVSKGYPTEPLKRNDTGNCLRHERRHATWASVEKEWVVSVYEKLHIQREAAGRRL